MNAGKIVDALVRKKWPSGFIRDSVGPVRGAYQTFALNPEVRKGAASGGTVTAMLTALLEEGAIDGAVVCSAPVLDGKVRARFSIAQSREEILSSQGSHYIKTHFLKEVPALIRAFGKRVAVVGLPCDLSALTRLMRVDAVLQRCVAFRIGLICGHTSTEELADEVTGRLEKKAGARLKKFRFRKGLWRGFIEAEFEDGRVEQKSAGDFDDYQNLYFFCDRKCRACVDHYAFDCDLSAGDFWLYRLKNESIKYTGILARTETGESALKRYRDRGIIHAQEVPLEMVVDGQSRTAPYHWGISARHKAGKSLGIHIPDRLRQNVKWHHHLNAWLSLFNDTWSRHPKWKHLIFKIPKPVLKTYLWFKKGLETLS